MRITGHWPLRELVCVGGAGGFGGAGGGGEGDSHRGQRGKGREINARQCLEQQLVHQLTTSREKKEGGRRVLEGGETGRQTEICVLRLKQKKKLAGTETATTEVKSR